MPTRKDAVRRRCRRGRLVRHRGDGGRAAEKPMTHATKAATTVHVKGDAKLKAEAKVSEARRDRDRA